MALRLSPSGYQKIMASRSAPRTAQATSTSQPKSPDSTGQAIGLTRSALNFAGQGSRILGAGQNVATGLSGLQAAGQAAQGIQQIRQGQTFPGALNLAGAGAGVAPTVARLSGAAPQTVGTVGQVGGAVGAGLGLASGAYSLFQGRNRDMDPSVLPSMVSGTGSLLSAVSPAASAAATAGMSGGAAAGTTALGTGASGMSAVGAAGAGLTGIGAVMGIGMGVGNAVNAFMSGDDRQLGTGIGHLAGLAVGAGVGTLIAPGVGTLIGAAIGTAAGGALGGLFGQNVPHYYAIRQHAADVGKGALGDYTKGLIAAGGTGDVNQVQNALSQSWADNRVRIGLDLPSRVAQSLGLPEQIGNEELRNLPPEKFMQLLKVFRENKGLTNNWVTGSSDIPYLQQGSAEKLAGTTAGAGAATLNAMAEHFGPQLDAMPSLAPVEWEEVGDYRLPKNVELSRYETYTGVQGAGKPEHLRNQDYNQLRAMAAGNQMNTDWTVRGTRFAEDIGGGRFMPTEQFLSEAGKTNKAKAITERDTAAKKAEEAEYAEGLERYLQMYDPSEREYYRQQLSGKVDPNILAWWREQRRHSGWGGADSGQDSSGPSGGAGSGASSDSGF